VKVREVASQLSKPPLFKIGTAGCHQAASSVLLGMKASHCCCWSCVLPAMQEVLWRVGNSLIGAFSANFMQVTHERPDL
jgi:hypothetical protein